jgi:hypothetical protein
VNTVQPTHVVVANGEKIPPLENGDHLDRATFHQRYEAMPPDTRAELIGGIVYLGFQRKLSHGRAQASVICWLGVFNTYSAGTDGLGPVTLILGPGSEPEPDACLILLPENGGQTWEDADGYLNGAPELCAEIAWGPESIDLHRKKADYEEAGVREYLVVALREEKVYWFVRRRDRFEEMATGRDGVLRSEVFPGLWLDPEALLRKDKKRLLAVLRQGLASPEHAAFVARLGAK